MRPVANRARPPELTPSSGDISKHTDNSSSLAVLGGLRTVMADLTWLRAYVCWERRDAPATETLLKLTTTLDPQPLYFWLNGARMMAYDFPGWLATERTSDAEMNSLNRQQARRAIDFLAEAFAHHPDSAALWIERGNIELHRLHDLPAAAQSYRNATEASNAPYFAGRIYAELLRRTGRTAEALGYLITLYPKLPPDDEAASAALVLSRIRSLEAELSIPQEQQFQ